MPLSNGSAANARDQTPTHTTRPRLFACRAASVALRPMPAITFALAGTGQRHKVHAFITGGAPISICGRAAVLAGALEQPAPKQQLSCSSCRARLRDFPPEKCRVEVSGAVVEGIAVGFEEKRVHVIVGDSLRWFPHTAVQLAGE